jgi:hypothetical protein
MPACFAASRPAASPIRAGYRSELRVVLVVVVVAQRRLGPQLLGHDAPGGYESSCTITPEH